MLMLILSTSYPALRGFHSGGGITYTIKYTVSKKKLLKLQIQNTCLGSVKQHDIYDNYSTTLSQSAINIKVYIK